MSKNLFSQLSTEKLLEKKKLLKTVLTAMATIWVILIVIAIYFYITKNTFKLFMPMGMFLLTSFPLFIQWSVLNKELKNRQQ